MLVKMKISLRNLGVDGRASWNRASHWDLEPVGRVTPCPPQFGNAQTARRGLTRPIFSFMDNPHSLFRMRWDHEPRRLRERRRPRRRDAHVQPAGRDAGAPRFMESPHGFDAVHWDHEPAWAIQSAAEPVHSKTWRKFER